MNMLEKAAKAAALANDDLDAHDIGDHRDAYIEIARAVLAAIREPDVAEAMARAHDQEQAAQIGEPNPWDEEGDDYQEFRTDRICAMQCAIDAILEGNK